MVGKARINPWKEELNLLDLYVFTVNRTVNDTIYAYKFTDQRVVCMIQTNSGLIIN